MGAQYPWDQHMKWTIEFVKHGNYFRVVNHGIYEAGDSVKLYQKIFSDKSWTSGSSILMDNRLVDYRNVNYRVMSQSSNSLIHYETQITNSKIGYIVSSQVGFGVCRQFQLLMEGKLAISIEVFTDEEMAVKWITEKQISSV